MTRNRRAAGTTLVEVLVVIVVFAVGILAVVQIFPRGLAVLSQAREASVASALARGEIERLKARPDQLPEQIVAIRTVDGMVVVDPDRTPTDLGPSGNRLASDGTLSLGSAVVGPWEGNVGANAFRRILGEGRRVPAPTRVGDLFGGLMVLQFGPLSNRTVADSVGGVASPVRVYGNELVRRTDLPTDIRDRRESYEFFVTSNGTDTVVHLPSTSEPRRYRIVASGYVASGSGVAKRDLVGLPPVVVPVGTPDAYGNYPLFSQSVAALAPGVIGVEFDSVRVSPMFSPVTAFSSDPWEYMVLDPALGVLLFNPAAAEVQIPSTGGAREPLKARVDYDVSDWRILRDEFRIGEGPNPQHRLPVGNLKVGGLTGPDGRILSGVFLETTTTPAFADISSPKADHFVALDLTTGGMLAEVAPGGNQSILLDKTLGLVTFVDTNPSVAGVQGRLLLPGASSTIEVNLANRPVRALFMANNEWSVQVLKAAATYTLATGSPGAGEYYIGGTNPVVGGIASRIYFARSEAGRKVTLEEATVQTASGAVQVASQDFAIAFRSGPGEPSLPSLDLRDVVSGATGISFANGYGLRGLKGASVAVRVLRNPTRFALKADPAANLTSLEQWGRNWKRVTTETFLQRGENIR